MHKRISIFITCAALVLTGAVTFAQEAAEFEPLRITIQRTNGDDTVGFILKASEKAIQWKYTPESPTANVMPRAEIKNIEFERPEQWSVAAAYYARGNYAEAEKGFAEIAEMYKDIMLLEGSPSSEAKYYQLESLRRQGKFEEMEKELVPETLEALQISLPDGLAFQLNLNKVWAAAAGGKWEIVDQLVAEHALDKEGEGEGLPGFKPLPPSQLVQLAFMRALSSEAKEQKEAAVGDYYRTLTLGFGNDRSLSEQAALKLMAILAEDPELAKREVKLKQMHALAMHYKNALGSGEIPEEYAEYAVPYVSPEEEAAAAEAPAADGEAAPEGEAMPAEEGAPGEAEGADGEAAPEGEAMPAEEGAPGEAEGEPAEGEAAEGEAPKEE